MLNRFAHLIGNDVPGALNMWRVLSVTKFISIAVCAAEPLGNDEVTDAEIEKLVTCLISPNQAPQIPGIIAKYPANFDKAAQKEVKAAWIQLRNLAPRSFPFLFDHLSDKHYAITEDSGDLDKNYTVGFLCSDILVSYLQPDVWDHHKNGGTSFRRRPNQPDYIRHFRLDSPESAKKWWETRKQASLLELQIEVLEWVLAEEEKHPDKYTEKDRALVQKELDERKLFKVARKPSWPFSK